ncbi:MAG: prefoldin subunit alpha [Thermoprotei archaeon]|nr:MAG: prefoldin subunit alpha [Thermoprotei archaeon]
MCAAEGRSKESLSSEYALLSQIASELKNRIELINVAINDMEIALYSLKEISKLMGGETILVPIGGNIMVRASYLKNEKVLVNVGSGVVVEKSFDEAISYIENRIKLLREELQKRTSEYQNVLSRMSYIERQIIGKQK